MTRRPGPGDAPPVDSRLESSDTKGTTMAPPAATTSSVRRSNDRPSMRRSARTLRGRTRTMSPKGLVAAAVAALTTVAVAVAAPVHASSADFAVSVTGPTEVSVSDTGLIKVVVAHQGKGHAGTTVSVSLPPQLVVTGVSDGSCTWSPSRVDCSFPRVSGAKPVTVSIGVHATRTGTGETVATLPTDPDPSDNTASLTTTVDPAPVPVQTASAPYEEAYMSRYGFADAGTGRTDVVITSGCTAHCAGEAGIEHRFLLSGSGQRSVDVDVAFDVHTLSATAAAAADTSARVFLFSPGGRVHACSTDLDPPFDEAVTGPVTVRCSVPGGLPGGSSIAVQAELFTTAAPLVDVEARAFVRSITVSGTVETA